MRRKIICPQREMIGLCMQTLLGDKEAILGPYSFLHVVHARPIFRVRFFPPRNCCFGYITLIWFVQANGSQREMAARNAVAIAA